MKQSFLFFISQHVFKESSFYRTIRRAWIRYKFKNGSREIEDRIYPRYASHQTDDSEILISIAEHFSTPLHFAIKHFGLEADIKPFPTGTGALTASLKDDSIDVAIGLTEGFVADLGKTNAKKETPAYKLVGTYVESPLCWAISVGNKSKIDSPDALNGKRVGVSRIGR